MDRMRSLYIECAFWVEWISRPLHKWIPSTPRSRSPAHFLPQKAHSIYSKRILSVRTHSISREHILSTKKTFHLQRTQSSQRTHSIYILSPPSCAFSRAQTHALKTIVRAGSYILLLLKRRNQRLQRPRWSRPRWLKFVSVALRIFFSFIQSSWLLTLSREAKVTDGEYARSAFFFPSPTVRGEDRVVKLMK